MAGDQYAAREIFQTVFKGTHGVYVNIVRRFVKQDDVGTGFEHPGGVYAVPFAAGQDVNLLLLIRAREVETGAIGAGVDFPVAELDRLGTVADQLIYGLARRQGLTLLIHIRELNGVADGQRARVRLFLPHKHLEERRLTRTVRADDAHDSARRNDEIHIFHQFLVAEGLADAHGFDDLLAQTGACGDIDFQFGSPLFAFVAQHGLIGVDARLALGMAALGGHADPFQLTAEGLAALVLGLVFLSEALFFLLQPRGIIALPRNPAATIQLENPSRDVVEEVTVVGHGNDRTGEILEVPFQPRHGFGVQVVGRFVEQKNVGILQQQAAQRHAALFTTGDDGNGRVPRRAPQGIHRHLKLGVKIPCTLRIHELLHLPLAFDEFIHFLRLHGLGEFGIDLFELLD